MRLSSVGWLFLLACLLVLSSCTSDRDRLARQDDASAVKDELTYSGAPKTDAELQEILADPKVRDAVLRSMKVLPVPWLESVTRTASCGDFDHCASAGGFLDVVFFGASLTWGANATDPNLTSYRGVIARRLEERYPRARFRFYDAAIGGTGSQLGVFRLERDVLRRKPDLVFLDFSANDDIYSDTPETLASYEAIVRRLVAEAKAPVVMVIFPFQWNVAQGNTNGMKRRDAHLRIADAYNVPVGDAITLGQRRVKEGTMAIPEIWPTDGVHPGDSGYWMFANAAWGAFLDGVEKKRVCSAPPKMLHADTYMTSARVRLSTLGKLPAGWRVGSPNLTSAWYDALMSRWLDDVVIAANRSKAVDPATKKESTAPQKVERLRVRFNGSMALLFGEKTPKSCRYRVWLDGKIVEHKEGQPPKVLDSFDASSKQFGGNVHLTQVIAEGLDPKADHTLEVEPLFAGDEEQELRIESLCVAGGAAKVWREE